VAVIRTVRFQADPTHAAELVARRAQLICAVRAAHAGLAEARLARVGEDTWVDRWRWDSPASMQAALAALPEAAAAFSLTHGVTAEEAELIDERWRRLAAGAHGARSPAPGYDVARDPGAVRAPLSLTGQYASLDEDLTRTGPEVDLV